MAHGPAVRSTKRSSSATPSPSCWRLVGGCSTGANRLLSQVYHYDQWEQYDGSDPKTGLFTGYINSFLKIKQEASGWPDWVKSEADQDTYIDRYQDNEGINLDKESIKKNGGLRTLAKLMLNSFWCDSVLA